MKGYFTRYSKYLFMRQLFQIFTVFTLLLPCKFLLAQKNNAKNKSLQQIEIQNSDRFSFDKKIKDAQKLIGNVRVKHEGMTLFCDSALYFTSENKLNAYGKIHLKQGDTLNIYADSVFYFGATQIAKLRGKIRLIERDLKLDTDSIDFDRLAGIAYYTNGARIVSQKNNVHLTSKKGIYYTATKQMHFKEKVMLKHPEYEMTCDTLIYLTNSDKAIFSGPTLIRTEDNGVIYCEAGWYDINNDISLFNKNTFFNKSEITLRADTVIYNRNKATGDAFGNIFFTDTTNRIILNGNRGFYNEKTSTFWITQKAYFTKILEKDSLYIGADTLIAITDTFLNKSNVFAWKRVKIFKNDLQGICDSLVYSEKDSLLKMFGKPVLWSDIHQLSAEYIEAYTYDGRINNIQFINNTFVISQADTVGYNQLKGKKMRADFLHEKIHIVTINGNGQTVYYVYDEQEGKKRYMGINKTDCSDIRIVFEDEEIKNVLFIDKPESVFYPIDQINPKDKLLKDFKWHQEKRPLSKYHIFNFNSDL